MTASTGIQFHTEATYTVNLRHPENAAPVTTQEGDFQPDYVSLRFTCTLADGANATPWQSHISMSGPWLDEREFPARCTVVPYSDFIPDWILPHIEQYSPNNIELRADGPPSSLDEGTEFALLLGARDSSLGPLRSLTSATLRHSVWSDHVQCDELIEVPDAHPGRRSRWIKPDSISVVYQWSSDLSSLGGDSWQSWKLADLSITGASVSPPGQPADVPSSGRLRAPLGTYPEWAHGFIAAHKPEHLYLHCSA